MKIRLIISTFSILILIFINSSCKKYLDAKPDKKLVVPTTIKDLQALLDNTSVMNEKSPSWDEASSDNSYLPFDLYQSLKIHQRNGYTWEITDYSNYPNDWSFIYDVVYYANIVLENIENIQRTGQNQNDWDNLKGSALLFRANSFLKAACIFSKSYDEVSASQDYGIALRLRSDFNVPSVRASMRETYDRILQDLKESATLLPVTPNHVLRPSKPAAYALLGRGYLSMGKYDSAYKYSDMSLQLNNQLVDYNKLDVDDFFPFQQFSKEILFQNTISSYTFLNIVPLTCNVDSNLYDSYSDNDLRKRAYFLDATLLGANGFYFKGTYDGVDLFTLFVGVANDEVYLMRAECQARRGNKDAALADLNTLMQNRWKAGTFVPFSSASAEEALNIILKERRKELIFRGLRWMDIKRLNKEGANITLTREVNGQTYTLSPNSNKYALPLPADIIKITGMPQNPQ